MYHPHNKQLCKTEQILYIIYRTVVFPCWMSHKLTHNFIHLNSFTYVLYNNTLCIDFLVINNYYNNLIFIYYLV